MDIKKGRLGLPGWVLIGAVAGLGAGVFLGDYAKILEPIGHAYIQLLAICVYPYLIASLLHGLGILEPPTAWRLLRHAWPSYVVGWGVAILAMMLLGAAFPGVSAPAVLGPETAFKEVSFIELLIPGNPFLDLTKNVVPAIVVFAFLYGMAIQRVKNKAAWLEILLVVKSASITIWNWVVFRWGSLPSSRVSPARCNPGTLPASFSTQPSISSARSCLLSWSYRPSSRVSSPSATGRCCVSCVVPLSSPW